MGMFDIFSNPLGSLFGGGGGGGGSSSSSMSSGGIGSETGNYSANNANNTTSTTTDTTNTDKRQVINSDGFGVSADSATTNFSSNSNANYNVSSSDTEALKAMLAVNDHLATQAIDVLNKNAMTAAGLASTALQSKNDMFTSILDAVTKTAESAGKSTLADVLAIQSSSDKGTTGTSSLTTWIQNHKSAALVIAGLGAWFILKKG